MTKAKENPDPDMFSPYEREALLKECYEQNLIAYSGDAASESNGKGFWVPVNKLESFIDFVVSKCAPVSGSILSDKPYVGKVFRLARHIKMPVKPMNDRAYNRYVNTHNLFPEYCMILDETKTRLCVLGNDNTKYWISRYYFGKAAKDE